jgi:SET domain
MGHLSFSVLALAVVILSDSVHGLAAKPKVKTNKKSGSSKGFGVSKGPTFSHSPDTSPATQALIRFLKSQNAKGIENGVTEIGIQDGQRGLFATTDIKKDQLLCMIPSDVALALSDPSKFGEDAPTFAHGGLNFLKMYWNDEQARNTWAPYLDTLPTKDSPYFTPTPDYFSDEEIELLEFPRLVKSVHKRKQDIEHLAAENGLTVEELQFATWLVSSRAFNINLSDGEKKEDEQYDERGQVIAKAGAGLKSIRVMIPYLDMVNHDTNSPNCRFTMIDPEKDEAWFALEANRNIPAGREINIAYRSDIYSSVELLMNYGFVPEPNKVDSFLLRKGGDDTISSLDGWTTTLEEDQSMLKMMEEEADNAALKKILEFRSNIKTAYKDM